MKAAMILAAALLAAPLAAQKAPAKAYQPDLKAWTLEVSPALGGWSSDRTVPLRVKLVDPHDPNPPQEASGPALEGEEEEGFDPGAEDTRTAAQLRQARLDREAEASRNRWRDRTLKVWLNGTAHTWSVRVGHVQSMDLTAQNGENRLEILEPDSGLRVVRTWWVSTSRTRLRVAAVQRANEWVSGGLQVMEPDGAVAQGGRRTASGGMLRWSGEYTHDTPPPGTYTLKWVGGWRGGKPARVAVEVLLDGGTDQERRWTFERLILPGAGPVTFGTFDVEP